MSQQFATAEDQILTTPPGLDRQHPVSGTDIIAMAEEVGLDPRKLYEAVIDLAREGLLTATCINLAAGILLKDLGLPRYFFSYIRKQSLTQLLQAIATNLRVRDGGVDLFGSVAHVDFVFNFGSQSQRVRIATEETRAAMEDLVAGTISGHRREYYYSPETGYSTYIIRPETVHDFSVDAFTRSRFLFSLAGDYSITPEPTRKRYEKFLTECEQSVVPLIQAFNLPETGETRLMFLSDFETPQLPIFRKIIGDHGYTLLRAYWEPFHTRTSVSSSICSLYIRGELSRREEQILIDNLRDFLAFSLSPVCGLYLNGTLTFQEMLFAGNAIDFTHMFIFNETEKATDREIFQSLDTKDHMDAFAKRIQWANKSTYEARLIEQTVIKYPDFLSFLFRLFSARFNPASPKHLSDNELENAWETYNQRLRSRFLDFPVGYDIFCFMFRIVSCTLKTNFFLKAKRSFSFRFDNRILDPLVFSDPVFGVFFVNGHYSRGTHLRAGDISRGGLRLIRVSPSNYEAELDNAVLLNYALGPKAQRIKHKDICESGAKGVVVPNPAYAGHAMESLYDYTEGIMDLILPNESIVDYYGRQEMIFFGPDEGTAPLMDAVALRARERGYRHWRTLTTGKTSGIPHDTYGLLANGEAFALYGRGDQGVELQIDGATLCTTSDMEEISRHIGGQIILSGMTTTSVMTAFRTMIDHYGRKEEDLHLMITGGPDGDLGANQIQCYKGRICLILDGGSVLFDPDGLDKNELQKLAFARHTAPRLNSLAYPLEKLGKNGFLVPIHAKNIQLPDGRMVEDGTYFHRTFLTDPKNRESIEKAEIHAFIPCGGFKDTINQSNVRNFLDNFRELKFIVEGANVFFDDCSRRLIAETTAIKQIKDTTANKGGVFSSSIAEVLTAFLFGDNYKEKLIQDTTVRWGLITNVMQLVTRYAEQETQMLIRLHEADPTVPLFDLSFQSSEAIFALQAFLESKIDVLLADDTLVKGAFHDYIPAILIDQLGLANIAKILSDSDLQSYRNAILTKKLAAMAFYHYGSAWPQLMDTTNKKLLNALHKILPSSSI